MRVRFVTYIFNTLKHEFYITTMVYTVSKLIPDWPVDFR